MTAENDLELILTQALDEVKSRLWKINLAEIGRITGVNRQWLRKCKEMAMWNIPLVKWGHFNFLQSKREIKP